MSAEPTTANSPAQVPAEAGAVFASVYTWPTITVIIAIAAVTVWICRRRFDVQTGVMVGLAVIIGLTAIVMAYAVGYGVGAHDAAAADSAVVR